MAIRSDVLRVYETGKLMVIGFGRIDKLGEIDIVECHAEILELLKLHDSSVLVIDLMDVNYVPSSLLGMLASLTRTGVEVHVYNVSRDVRRVLEITRLERLFTIQEHLLCD